MQAKLARCRRWRGRGGPVGIGKDKTITGTDKDETITDGQVAINWANIAARVRICMNQVVLS